MEIVKWGLIGCGDIARKRVVYALQNAEKSELIAASRANASKIKEFTREFGIPRSYDTWQELVDDPEIDAVYIASPVVFHAEQTIAAAAAGKHILCEKPMALDPDECRRMIDACKKNNVTLSIAYYRHFYPVIGRIREIINRNELGTPVLAQLNAFVMFDPDTSHPRYWLLRKNISGGGPLKDFGCHRIEVLHHLFGKHRTVTAITGNALFDREVEDTAVVSIGYESRVIGTLSVSHAVSIPHDTLTIHFSEGKLYVPVLNGSDLEITTKENVIREHHPPHGNLHQPLIADFIEAVNNHHETGVPGTTGLEVEKIISRVYSLSNDQKIV